MTAAPDRIDLTWHRLCRLLEPFRVEQLRYAMKNYGPVALEEAWQAFTLGKRKAEHFRPDNPHMPAFMPWFYHRWSPDKAATEVRDARLHGVPPTRAYLDRGGARSAPLLRAYLESCLESISSFYEVLESDPGQGLRLRDVLTGAEHTVIERTASKTVQSGDVIFARLAGAAGVTILETCSPFAYSPADKIEVLNFRERFGGGALLTQAALRELDSELLGLYHALTDRRLTPVRPELRNTDGDPLSPQRAVFDLLCPLPQALEALSALAPDEPEIERDAGGGIVHARLHWMKEDGRTLLGSIVLEQSRLVAETNSEARSGRLCALIEKALPGAVRHRLSEHTSLERLLDEASNAGGAARLPDSLASAPEARAAVAEMLERHYAGWVDEKIPALDGKTPKQAMRTASGREKVEALVREIETGGVRMSPPLDPQIVRRLRERLGLESRDT